MPTTPDTTPKVETTEQCGRQNPILHASWFSKLFFMFVSPIIHLARNRSLTPDDIWEVGEEYGSHMLGDRIMETWDILKTTSPHRSVSLTRCLWLVFRKPFSLALFISTFSILLYFAYPFLVYRTIMYVEDDSRPTYEGFIYVACFFLLPIVNGLFENHSAYLCGKVAISAKAGLCNIIFRKTLRMSLSGRSESTLGQIQNLMSTDAERVQDAGFNLLTLYMAPIQLLGSLVWLYLILGVASLIGLLVLFIFAPIAGKTAGKLFAYQMQKMGKADERVKTVNEMLLGIRIIKYYVWEFFFQRSIDDVRKEELNILKKMMINRVIFKTMVFLIPIFVVLVTFVSYVMLGNELTPTKVFTALTIYNILRFPVVFLPLAIVSIIQGNASLKRISTYMYRKEVCQPSDSKEVDVDGIVDEKVDDPALRGVTIEHARMIWSKASVDFENRDSSEEKMDEFKKENHKKDAVEQEDAQLDDPNQDEETPFGLSDISLTCHGSEFVAIVGSVGCGKSTILQSILGEVSCESGNIKRNGRIAYVSQEPWVMNASIRDNILFGEAYDEGRYKAVLGACALYDDLKQLPAGDQTEIGEKGINLSGGQKSRVSLARACYANADIYLLDDPLSAVDAHVGRHIFARALTGMLGDKPRIIVTQQLHILPNVDRIYLIADGAIAASGTYEDLVQSGYSLENILQVEHEKHEEDEEHKSTALDLRRSSAITVPRQSHTVSLGETQAMGISEDDTGDLYMEEEMTTGTSSTALLNAYFERAGGYVYVVGIVFIFLFVQSFFVGTELWLSFWTKEQYGDRGFLFYASIFFGIALACAIGMYIRGLCFVTVAMRTCKRFHADLLERVIRYPVSFFDVTPTGRIAHRFAKDTTEIDEMFTEMLENLLLLIVWWIGAVVIITMITPLFAIVLVPIFAIYAHTQRLYIPASRDVERLYSIMRSPIFAHFGETLIGLTVIRGFQRQKMFLLGNEERVDRHIESGTMLLLAGRWLEIQLQYINSLVVGSACLFIVLNRDNIDSSFAGLSLATATSLLYLLTYVVFLAAGVETRLVSIDRVLDYSSRPTESAWVIEGHRPDPLWPQSGVLEYDDVHMKYRDNLPDVLKGVSFRTKGGERIGIAGRTGSGKSSLLVSLFRMTEIRSGKILIDGVNVSEIGLHDLRSKITMIPQDPVLFSGTIRRNLDPFNQFRDDELWEALEQVQLKRSIESREGRLNGEVLEYGQNFSVGERQLFCLARALLKQSRIVVLDEATSDVDMETDRKIQKVIRQKFQGMTMLTIAHRLSTIIDSDRVLVMDAGKVGEIGTPNDLLQNEDSFFSKLVVETGPRESRILHKMAKDAIIDEEVIDAR